MKSSRKPVLAVLLVGLAFAAATPSTRADTVKQQMFQFGSDFWLLDNLAFQVSRKPGGPTAAEKKALTLFLERCFNDGMALGFPCDALLDLQRRGDKLTFSECTRELKTIRNDIFKHLEKTFGRQPMRGPSAQSYFLLGQYTMAAEFTALHIKLSGLGDNRGNRNFIHNMCSCAFVVRHNAKLEISLAPLKVATAMSRLNIDDCSIAELHDCLRTVRETWNREIGKAPPLAVGVMPAAANVNDVPANAIRGDASSVQRRNR